MDARGGAGAEEGSKGETAGADRGKRYIPTFRHIRVGAGNPRRVR